MDTGQAVKAWHLNFSEASFAWVDTPEPAVRAGTVLVRLEAAVLVSCPDAHLAGHLPAGHAPWQTFTPGTHGVGVIEQVGAGVDGLAAGDRVLLAEYLRPAGNSDGWPGGTLAERVVVPAPTVTPIPSALLAVPGTRLATLGRFIVPYGGFLRARLTAGETVIVNGATSAYGTAAIQVGLAMGAARVVAASHDEELLARLPALGCTTSVRLAGDVESDAATLRAAANTGVSGTGAARGADCALDLAGDADLPNSTLATLAALGRGGRLVLMGGMSRTLPISYPELMINRQEIIGNYLYPPPAPARLMRLAASGLLDLERVDTTSYELADLPAALDHAAQPGAPLVTVTP